MAQIALLPQACVPCKHILCYRKPLAICRHMAPQQETLNSSLLGPRPKAPDPKPSP